MTLIKSISGIRGTIGGKAGNNFTPIDIVQCTSAYGQYIKQSEAENKVVIGRDGRISGEIVSNLVTQTLRMMGIDVIDLDLTTTPTVEMAVPMENAGGGIILTASHNPKEWNALKFLNAKGEFISAAVGEQLLQMIADNEQEFVNVEELGTYKLKNGYLDKHIEKILDLDLIDAALIRSKKFKVIVDPINSTGALAIPPLLKALDVEYRMINHEITGDFAHNPEPLPAHLADLSQAVVVHKADMGISVDPDVDRLAFVMEDGAMFGEEYTLVAIADYILSKTPGNTVSNLSSTRALRDVTEKKGGKYHPSKVGEVNVVQMMKDVNAVIGGEGNGGIILPQLHYGRDALVGIALMLNLLAETDMSLSTLRSTYPDYSISKNKILLTPDTDIEAILEKVQDLYKDEKLTTIDGVKINFEEGWVHLRKSNTEPIIRVYAESSSIAKADELAKAIMDKIS